MTILREIIPFPLNFVLKLMKIELEMVNSESDFNEKFYFLKSRCKFFVFLKLLCVKNHQINWNMEWVKYRKKVEKIMCEKNRFINITK